MRAPHRRKRGAHALSSSSRQKLLIREAGVTPSEIFIARREASYIRSSRRKQQINTNGMLQQYDETAAMVMENCVRTVQQLMNGNMSECELRSLMQQAERAKQQQRQQHLVNQ